MCGRLSLEKINTAIDEIQVFLNEKYRIMALSFHQLTDKVATKFKVKTITLKNFVLSQNRLLS
jgi:hypothetical protein